jgi:hypothetical protein
MGIARIMRPPQVILLESDLPAGMQYIGIAKYFLRHSIRGH